MTNMGKKIRKGENTALWHCSCLLFKNVFNLKPKNVINELNVIIKVKQK